MAIVPGSVSSGCRAQLLKWNVIYFFTHHFISLQAICATCVLFLFQTVDWLYKLVLLLKRSGAFVSQAAVYFSQYNSGTAAFCGVYFLLICLFCCSGNNTLARIFTIGLHQKPILVCLLVPHTSYCVYVLFLWAIWMAMQSKYAVLSSLALCVTYWAHFVLDSLLFRRLYCQC